MFSRGAINALPIAGLALNEGSFVETIAADQSVAIDAIAHLSRRASLAAASIVSVVAVAAVNRRRPIGGQSAVVAATAATMARRPILSGAARIEISGIGRFPRRPQMAAQEIVEILGSGNSSWRRLHQGSHDRQIMVRKEHRTIIVPSGRKDV